MNDEVRKRLTWIKLYEDTQNAGLVCRHCGISRPTLRKWLKRYGEHGLKGLYGIKFRPNKPGSPHLHGKVERSQRTDKEEFYSTANLDFHELQTVTLPEWQHYYNWQRAHGSFKGKTPMEVVCDHLDNTPIWEEVHQEYQDGNKRIQLSNYKHDLQLRKLKGCL